MGKMEVLQHLGTGQKIAYPTEYLSKYWINLRQNVSIRKSVYEDYYVDKSFVITQGKLLW